MTLYNIVSILKAVAASQPNIRTTTDGSVYDALNTNPAIQYDVFHISQTNHREDENYDYYGFNLFYISRLEDSLEDNRLQIQSIGKEVLSNIIRTFSENFGIDYPTITYFPFTQRFNDLCAGVYCSIQLDVPKEIWCADDYVAEVVPGSGIKLQDMGITITQNGLIVITPDAEYDGIGEIRIETNVPQTAAVLQDKEVEYTENGSYSIHPDPAYDGMSSVSVDVLVPDNYDEGYDDGKEDGKNEQKAKLTVTSFTENNTYTREDGWSAVTVNVPATEDRYDEGYADGEAAQKAKMVATAITENGAYGRPDGYSAITVNVPSNYQDGYDDGVEDQKGKLTTLSVNENGIYTREDGWSAITVNVPQTGSSNEDLIANLQGDYFLIPDGTTHLRDYALYGACFSSITIPTSVSAIGNYAFAYNDCLTSITIPDSVQTMGEFAFNRCTNLETVHLGTGLTRLQTSTFVNCGSLTGITIPSGITQLDGGVFYYCSGLTEMTFEGLVPPTIDIGSSLGSTAYTFPIYVPCESIDAYKTAFGSYYAPRIQCIEPPQPTGATAITAITVVVDSAITDSGVASSIYSPVEAPTDIYYSVSHISYASIDSRTGVLTVKRNGQIAVCAYDAISELQNCKQVTLTRSDAITALTINVSSAITDSGTATTTYSPSTGTTDIFYYSSDPSIATIDSGTGVITVIADGTVQFCAKELISGLQDCKTVNVSKTPVTIPYTADTSNIAATGETRCVTIDTTGLNTSTIGLVYTGATGLTYTVSGNQVCITFPNNTGLPRTINVKITATTTGGGSAYADITYNQLCSESALGGALMIKYRVTSSTQPTQVVTTSSIGSFASYAIYNGRAYTTNTKYMQFPTTGDLWVYYILKDPTTCPAAFNAKTVGATETDIPITVVEVRMPDTIIHIKPYSFYWQTNLTAATLGNSLEHMDHHCFSNCRGMEKIYIPSTYTGDTYMSTITGTPGQFQLFGTGVKVYYQGSLKDWLTKITFKGNTSNPLNSQGSLYVNSTSAFNGTLITRLTIPADVSSVSDFAFAGCSSITSITLHSGVSFLGYACFDWCINVTGVTNNRTTPQTLATTFEGPQMLPAVLQFNTLDNRKYPIYVPSSSVDTYKTAENWSTYADRITAITN